MRNSKEYPFVAKSITRAELVEADVLVDNVTHLVPKPVYVGTELNVRRFPFPERSLIVVAPDPE